jgi:hypothetical protein
VAAMDGFKREILNFKSKFWTFSKIEIWTLIQGFRSNKFELKVWSIFKILFEGLNQGLWKFDEKEFEF